MVTITDYDNILSIPIDSEVDFQEFTLDRHQKPRLAVQVKGKLHRIVKSTEGLSREELEEFYPEIKQTEDFVALSVYPFYRLILVVGSSQLGVPIYKAIHTNKYFIHVNLQKVSYKQSEKIIQQVIPQNILGYDSYEVGQKFKR